MKVAALSLTRDRLAYTKHCFQTLAENAGCDYDHYVLDQGSEDGTQEWLLAQQHLDVTLLEENIGICRALNHLLDTIGDDYDAVVKFDNDCELLTPNTLRDVCEASLRLDAILSPHIHGLRNTPPTLATISGVSVTPGIGGIFMAAPATVFTTDGYRHNERNPLWGGDDHDLSAWFGRRGGLVGYLDGYHANHYLTTDGQHNDNPGYFARKANEAAA